MKFSISLIRAATAAAALAAAACQTQTGYVAVDGAMLGTTVHVAARTGRPAGEIYAAMMDIDSQAKASMSVFDPASRLNRLNANMTDSLDEHIEYNIRLAERISRISGGRYDITVKPLVEAWGFIRRQPDANPDIDSILAFVGHDKIRIEGGRLVKSDPRVQIDLNSIAKGYTVDLAARQLEQMGIGDYIVEIGGEIRCRGVNPRGGAWVVGIDSPFDGNDSPGSSLQTRIALSDKALATSGNYRRYWTDDQGRKVAHTIDPLTGRSSVSRLLSATVIAGTCAEADALCTMFMAMGDRQAIELARKADTLAVYFILDADDGDGDGGFGVFCSEPMKRLIIE